MPKRKLTDRLKEQIKRDYRRLKQSDFEGESLAYLKQVRGGHKGRVTQKKLRQARKEKVLSAVPSAETKSEGNPIVIGDKSFPAGSKIYEIITLSAKNTGVSTSRFIKDNEGALKKLISNYLVASRKEIDDLRELIKDLPKSSKIFSPVRGGQIGKTQAHFILHMIKKTLLEMCSVYPQVFIEYFFDLDANLHFHCPRPGEYKEFEDCSELKEYLEDRYPDITWIDHDGNI